MQFVKGQVEVWTQYIKCKKKLIWQNHSCEKCVSKWDRMTGGKAVMNALPVIWLKVSAFINNSTIREKYQHFYIIREYPLIWKDVPGLTMGWKGKLVYSWIQECHKTFRLKQQFSLSNFTPWPQSCPHWASCALQSVFCMAGESKIESFLFLETKGFRNFHVL